MWGGGGELLTCPYPLKVQVRPPRDQRLAIRSKVSGQGNSQATSSSLIFTDPKHTGTLKFIDKQH